MTNKLPRPGFLGVVVSSCADCRDRALRKIVSRLGGNRRVEFVPSGCWKAFREGLREDFARNSLPIAVSCEELTKGDVDWIGRATLLGGLEAVLFSKHESHNIESSTRLGLAMAYADVIETDKDEQGVPRAGSLQVYCGGMFSGKTSAIIRKWESSRSKYSKMIVCKPAADSRSPDGTLVSHDGMKLSGVIALYDAAELPRLAGLGRVDILAIDEAQFLAEPLSSVLPEVIGSGVDVCIATLDRDYLGRVWAGVPNLLGQARIVVKLSARCVICGAAATMSFRLTDNADQIHVGDRGEYEARCKSCYVKSIWRNAKCEAMLEMNSAAP